MTTTVRAEPQHKTALAKANTTRLHRAALRRAVHTNQIPATTALTDPACATAYAAEILGWQKGWSQESGELLLHEVCQAGPAKLAGLLTCRQIDLIREALTS